MRMDVRVRRDSLHKPNVVVEAGFYVPRTRAFRIAASIRIYLDRRGCESKIRRR
jgi:hypothetical protein